MGRISLKGLENNKTNQALSVKEQEFEKKNHIWVCQEEEETKKKDVRLMWLTGMYLLKGWVFCYRVSEVRQVVALALMVWSGGCPCHQLVVVCFLQGAWLELALGCGLLDTPLFLLKTVVTGFLYQ